MNSPDLIWNRIRDELSRLVPQSTFDVWLAPLDWGGIDGEKIVITAPPEVYSWVNDRFLGVLRIAAGVAIGSADPPEVELQASSDHITPVKESEKTTAGRGTHHRDWSNARARRLHPKYTFEQFVLGRANRFAHAAALAAAELPGAAYNPLLLVGPPGVGKTHLLHSIGNYVTAYGGGLTVRYTTAEDFTNNFRAALESRTIDPFKFHFRGADVLLIDDVQFLARKQRTEEEFFHTFNAVRESGSQIVLTADRPPKEMAGLEERLCQRFESGLMVEIEPPDLSMRRTIVRKRAQVDGHDFPDSVIEAISARVTDTVRSLEAALIRIAAYASLTGDEVSVPLAEKVLDQLYGRERTRAPKAISIDSIQAAVAESFEISKDELLSNSRAKRVTWPRQIAMYLARECTNQSLPSIGEAFGGRDHTTVLHAHRRTIERAGSDPESQRIIAALKDRLSGVVHD